MLTDVSEWRGVQKRANESNDGGPYLFLGEIWQIAKGRGYSSSVKALQARLSSKGTRATDLVEGEAHRKHRAPKLYSYEEAEGVLKDLGKRGGLTRPLEGSQTLQHCLNAEEHKSLLD